MLPLGCVKQGAPKTKLRGTFNRTINASFFLCNSYNTVKEKKTEVLKNIKVFVATDKITEVRS